MSNSLWLHELQHARLTCPSLSPWVCSNSCPLSQWCHPTLSSSIAPFSSCPQSFPASGSFLTNQLFVSGEGLEIQLQHSPSNEYSGLISFRINRLDLLAVQKALSKVFSSTTVWKHQFLSAQPSLWFQLSHPHMTTDKAIVWTIGTFVCKVMSLLFNMLSRFVIAFFQGARIF